MVARRGVRRRSVRRRGRRVAKHVKKRNRYASGVGLSRLNPGFPQGRVVNHRYVSSEVVSPGALGVPDVISLKANSPFQPAAGGGDAQGFDQWQLFYEDWICTSSKIRVQFTGKAEGTGIAVDALFLGVHLDNNATLGANWRTVIMQGNTPYRMVAPNGTQSYTISNRFNAKKFFNVTDVKDNKARIGGTGAADPADLAYYNIMCQSINESTIVAIWIMYVIDYTVVYSQPRDLAVS